MNVNFFTASNVTCGRLSIITYGATPQVFNFPKWNPYNVGSPVNNVRYGLIPLFSMEEVLMNRAEAYARTQNFTAALADLNTWVSRNIDSYNPAANNVTPAKATAFYGLPATDALVEAALDFKRVTYMQEGIRWLDNIRLGMPILRYNGNDFSTVIDSIPAGDPRRVLQLPPEAQAAGLEPNPK